MEITVIRRALAFIMLVTITTSAHSEGPATTSRDQQIRNYALAACVSHSYNDPKVVKDAQDVAAAYIEFKVLPGEAERIQDLVTIVLKTHYSSFDGSELLLMKCMDFANGPKVTAIIKQR